MDVGFKKTNLYNFVTDKKGEANNNCYLKRGSVCTHAYLSRRRINKCVRN